MKARKILDISAMAFADAIDIRFLIETCEAGNQPAAIALVNAEKTVKVVECIYRSLWTRLVIIVARAYAENTRHGDLHVQYAFELLKDSSIRAAVESKGNAAALTEAMALWIKCRGDHRLPSFRAFRDKQIAHRSELDSTIGLPIINDILAVSRNTAAAFEKLAQGTGAVTLSLDSQLITYPEQATRFWERIDEG